MSQWAGPDRCQLCGNAERIDLRWSLVRWAVAEPGMSYEHIARCKDEPACKDRVTAEGEPWPLVERRTAA